MIEDLCSNVQEKYLTNLQLNEPIQFCFSMASRLVTSKARLFLYQQYRNSWNGQTLPENMKIEYGPSPSPFPRTKRAQT